MSKLNVALVIGAVLLVAGASDAQAAKIRLPLFDLFGLGTPHVLVTDPGRHAPVIDFDDQGNGNKKVYLAPVIAPDDSRDNPWSENPADKGDWSPQGTDETDTGDWQQIPEAQDPQWTMQTATRP